MKVYIILAVKLILIWLAVYYFTDPHMEMARHDSDPVCLQSTTDYQLCAQCFRKGDDVIRSKGFRVVTTNTSSVLKIPGADDYLTCSELLQLVDFQQDSSSGQEFHLEEVKPITRILNQIHAKFSFKKQPIFVPSEYIVQPWYKQFVVYKWTEISKLNQVTVSSVNPEYYLGIKASLFYIFNFVLLVVLVAYMADSKFITELPNPVKLSLACMLVCFELEYLGLWSWTFHYLGRLFVLNIGLLQLRVNNLKVLAYFGVGLIMTFFPLSLCIYVGMMTILVVYYGKEQSQTRSVKLYLVILYTLLLLNYSYWYQFTLYLSDVPSLVIEFCTLIFIPTGIFLLPNQKEFQAYTPTDPEIRSISLSGFDEDEDQ